MRDDLETKPIGHRNTLKALQHLNNIGVVNDKIGNIEDFNDDLRVTGPHNSYLFFILKYGIIGFVLYLTIFLKLLQKIFKSSLKDSASDPSVLSIVAFIILGIASDLLHNHTVVWLMYYLLSDINE